MGYYATGEGDLVLKEPISDDIEKLIEEEFEITDVSDEDKDIYVLFDHKYHEDDVWGLLDEIAPKVKEGSIVFTGESNDHWRFIYNPDTSDWELEDGRVIWASETGMTDDENRRIAELLRKSGEPEDLCILKKYEDSFGNVPEWRK